MKRSTLRISIGIGILFAVFIAVYTFILFTQLGAFYQPYNLAEGQCHSIGSVAGPEDLQLDFDTGIIFISSFDRRAELKNEGVDGGIFMLDLNKNRPKPVRLESSALPEFRPHGISLYKNKAGTDRLFVISHRRDSSVVEIFEIEDDYFLNHKETVSGELLVSPNNLTAVDSRQFYVTNDGRSRSRIQRSLDTFFKWKTGNIIYYNGYRFVTVVDNLAFPNGIHADVEDKKLYVAETIGGYLRMYQWQDSRETVTQKMKAKIGRGMDNINPYGNNHFLVGRHPNLIALNRHLQNESKASPSQVLKVGTGGTDVEVDTVYSNTGTTLSGSSAVVFHEERMLIGAAFDSNMLLCERE